MGDSPHLPLSEPRARNAARARYRLADAPGRPDARLLTHRLPIDGTLDLHAFRPQDVGDVVADYLEACAETGILEVRVVHGKGIGALRRTVEAALRRHPLVASFRTAGEDAGGWGATLVSLRRPG